MKAKIKSSGEIVEVVESTYQTFSGRYFACYEKGCLYREDKLDFCIPEIEQQ